MPSTALANSIIEATTASISARFSASHSTTAILPHCSTGLFRLSLPHFSRSRKRQSGRPRLKQFGSSFSIWRGWLSQPSPNIIYDPMPNLTFHRFSAHNNPRFVPQQSIASFSNIDDIEGYITGVEASSERKHLTIIDIPTSERKMVISELRLMGITPGSLFPGLDGLCRTLKAQHFDCGY
jgi:hypothetical protein